MASSSLTAPRGRATPLPRRAQPLLLLFRSNPPIEGGGEKRVPSPDRARSWYLGAGLNSIDKRLGGGLTNNNATR